MWNQTKLIDRMRIEYFKTDSKCVQFRAKFKYNVMFSKTENKLKPKPMHKPM